MKIMRKAEQEADTYSLYNLVKGLTKEQMAAVFGVVSPPPKPTSQEPTTIPRLIPPRTDKRKHAEAANPYAGLTSVVSVHEDPPRLPLQNHIEEKLADLLAWPTCTPTPAWEPQILPPPSGASSSSGCVHGHQTPQTQQWQAVHSRPQQHHNPPANHAQDHSPTSQQQAHQQEPSVGQASAQQPVRTDQQPAIWVSSTTGTHQLVKPPTTGPHQQVVGTSPTPSTTTQCYSILSSPAKANDPLPSTSSSSSPIQQSPSHCDPTTGTTIHTQTHPLTHTSSCQTNAVALDTGSQTLHTLQAHNNASVGTATITTMAQVDVSCQFLGAPREEEIQTDPQKFSLGIQADPLPALEETATQTSTSPPSQPIPLQQHMHGQNHETSTGTQHQHQHQYHQHQPQQQQQHQAHYGFPPVQFHPHTHQQFGHAHMPFPVGYPHTQAGFYPHTQPQEMAGTSNKPHIATHKIMRPQQQQPQSSGDLKLKETALTSAPDELCKRLTEEISNLEVLEQLLEQSAGNQLENQNIPTEALVQLLNQNQQLLSVLQQQPVTPIPTTCSVPTPQPLPVPAVSNMATNTSQNEFNVLLNDHTMLKIPIRKQVEVTDQTLHLPKTAYKQAPLQQVESGAYHPHGKSHHHHDQRHRHEKREIDQNYLSADHVERIHERHGQSGINIITVRMPSDESGTTRTYKRYVSKTDLRDRQKGWTRSDEEEERIHPREQHKSHKSHRGQEREKKEHHKYHKERRDSVPKKPSKHKRYSDSSDSYAKKKSFTKDQKDKRRYSYGTSSSEWTKHSSSVPSYSSSSNKYNDSYSTFRSNSLASSSDNKYKKSKSKKKYPSSSSSDYKRKTAKDKKGKQRKCSSSSSDSRYQSKKKGKRKQSLPSSASSHVQSISENYSSAFESFPDSAALTEEEVQSNISSEVAPSFNKRSNRDTPAYKTSNYNTNAMSTMPSNSMLAMSSFQPASAQNTVQRRTVAATIRPGAGGR